jgi:hypothetical protein
LGLGDATACPPGSGQRPQLPSCPCGHRSEERGQTLMRLGRLSEYPEKQVAPYRLSAIPCAVSTTLGLSLPHLKAFSRGEPRIAGNRRRPLLSQTYPPLQGLAEAQPSARAVTVPILTGARTDCRRPTTLLGFSSLQRLRDQGSAKSGITVPAPFRPQRFSRSRRFDPPGPSGLVSSR